MRWVRGAFAGVVLAMAWSAALAQSVPSTQCVQSAIAAGTGDAITIPALPCALTTNLLILTTTSANATTTPTLQPLGLAAQVIVRPNGSPVAAGDLPSGYKALLNPTGQKWVLLNPATNGAGSVSLLAAGCVADGVTDQTACINGALAATSGCVIVDATSLGFYIAGTITVTKCLGGTTWTPQSPGLGYAGSSYLICNNQATQSCVAVNGSSKLAATISNITVVGAPALTPVNGSIGLQWTAGFNLTLQNVQVVNFGECTYLGPTAVDGTEPIHANLLNFMTGKCTKNYLVNDGTPEVYIVNSRWGVTGDYNTADNYIFSTKTTNSGAGGGPNTLVIDDAQINGGATGCVFGWGGIVGTGGVIGSNRIDNSHIEEAGNNYTGSGTRGFFCTDATVATVPQLQVTNSYFNDDGPSTKSLPTWNFNAASATSNLMLFSNNSFGSAATTLSINNLAHGAGPIIRGNQFASAMTFNAADTSAYATISDDTFSNGFAISGAWGRLGLSNNDGAITDTATGTVCETNQNYSVWTPVLTFGGASTGITYSVQTGEIWRTPTCGYAAIASLTLTSVGSATGTAVITGIPLQCLHGPGQNLATVSAMTGLTGAVQIQTAGGSTQAFITQSSSTGTAVLSNAAFTNTTSMSAQMTCGTAE